MNEKHCSICLSHIEGEYPDILTMGGLATPRYLCPDCAAKINTAASDESPEKIEAAMDELSARLSANNSDDILVTRTLSELFSGYACRAAAIKQGEWDFEAERAENEASEELSDIPEELKESEEDKELDRRESEMAKHFDSVMNWVSAIVLIGALAFLIWRFLL